MSCVNCIERANQRIDESLTEHVPNMVRLHLTNVDYVLKAHMPNKSIEPQMKAINIGI